VDEAVANPFFSHEELSELLANAGVLPMFGFPTRVRELFHQRVSKRSELDRSVLSDRPMNMAVASFSPGSLVVKDGRSTSASASRPIGSRVPRRFQPTHSTRPGWPSAAAGTASG